MSRTPNQKELELLNHIHSLSIVSDNQVSPGDLSALQQQGWIRKVWIGNYALTDTGKHVRRNNAAKTG